MIGATAVKEMLENVLSFKFAIVLLFLGTLLASSYFIMYNDYVLRVENYETLKPTENKKIAVIPPTPLSIFVKGLDESMGKSFRIQFGGQIEPGMTQQSVNPIFSLFTTPDMLYIVKVILSLCALLFSFDMISGEKASRTLSLSLSNSVSRTSLLIGKWIGGFVSFIVPLLMLFAAGVVLFLQSPLIVIRPDDWAKIGLFLVGTVLYLGFFYSLGLLISTLTSRPSTSIVISLLAWTVIVFALPNIGNSVASRIKAVPTIRQYEMRRNHIWVKEVFNVIQERKKDPSSQAFPKAIDRINSDNDNIRNNYSSQRAQLFNISKILTRISPAAAYTYFAMDIAGTGVDEDNRLKQAIIRYKNSVFSYSFDAEEVLSDDVPRFSFSRRTAGEVMFDEGLLNLMVLVLLTLAAFAGAYVVFLKYDVR